MQSSKRNNFTPTFKFEAFYFFFLFIIDLARNSSTMLQRNCDSRYAYIISDIREKPFNFSQFNVTLADIYVLYYFEVCSSCFYHK